MDLPCTYLVLTSFTGPMPGRGHGHTTTVLVPSIRRIGKCATRGWLRGGAMEEGVRVGEGGRKIEWVSAQGPLRSLIQRSASDAVASVKCLITLSRWVLRRARGDP